MCHYSAHIDGNVVQNGNKPRKNPAAGLLRFFAGDTLVVINKTPTPADRSADLVIQDAIGEVLRDL